MKRVLHDIGWKLQDAKRERQVREVRAAFERRDLDALARSSTIQDRTSAALLPTRSASSRMRGPSTRC
jgi:hypothetical protein